MSCSLSEAKQNASYLLVNISNKHITEVINHILFIYLILHFCCEGSVSKSSNFAELVRVSDYISMSDVRADESFPILTQLTNSLPIPTYARGINALTVPTPGMNL